ncbi:hypothetical protein [Kitasatospora paranensis]|uniref:DUF4253 domain-containing protein n=1 Tax=Kitasatospora paranensis TaxID=258053 RepID=A0ABW2FTI3_9ACTN
MTDLDPTSARRRLDAALAGLATALRGATAHPDEAQCECHWGSAEELALLKVPDVPLDPDLLRRTWQAPDWDDKGSVLRRILPQLAVSLTAGREHPEYFLDEVGVALGRGRWPEWPAPQAAAVEEFLHAWWAYSLLAAAPEEPPHLLLVLCVEASGELTPWLAAWAALEHPAADRRLAAALEYWADELIRDELPWFTWHDAPALRAELAAWLVDHAPARLRAQESPAELLHLVRLIGLDSAARWDDPHIDVWL